MQLQLLTQSIQSFLESVDNFHLYLLFIISNSEISQKHKIISLIIIYRTYQSIDQILLPEFINFSLPILQQSLFSQNTEIFHLSAAILSSFISYLGIDFFSEFILNTINFLQSTETTFPVFYLFQEITQHSLRLPNEILLIFTEFLESSNQFHFQALSIFLNVLTHSPLGEIENFIQFICTNVLPKLFELSNSYNPESLSICGIISIHVYIHNPSPLIGDYIATCLSINSPEIDDRVLTELFEKEEWISPYPPIILSLVAKLQLPDEDSSLYDRCSMSLSILYSLYDNNSDMMTEIISSVISTVPSNLGFLIRCVSVVIGVKEISENFLPIILNEIKNHGNERGEACLCLARYCTYNENACSESFEAILPLLADHDMNVRNQSIISIQSISDSFGDFQSNNEYLLFLIQLFNKMNKDDQNIHAIADLICFLLFHSNDFHFDALSQSFFTNSIEFLIKEDSGNFLFPSICSIVTAFIYKLPSFDEFLMIFDALITKIIPVIQEIHHNQNQVDDLYIYLEVLNAICDSLCINEIHFFVILRTIIEILNLEFQYKSIIQISIEISLKIFKNHWNLISTSDDFVEFFLTTLYKHFSHKDAEIASLSVRILIIMIPKMSVEHMQRFLKKCFFFLQIDRNKHLVVYEFGHQLLSALLQNQQPVEDIIQQFFLSENSMN